MSDPNLYLTIAVAALSGLAMIVAATLSGWRGWLELKHRQIGGDSEFGAAPIAAHVPSAGARIEIADLKERIRKLEAIASGVDL